MLYILLLAMGLPRIVAFDKLTDETVHEQVDFYIDPDSTMDAAKYDTIENWDTSLLTNTFCLFAGGGLACTDTNKAKGEQVLNFNADLSKWDLSGVQPAPKCDSLPSKEICIANLNCFFNEDETKCVKKNCEDQSSSQSTCLSVKNCKWNEDEDTKCQPNEDFNRGKIFFLMV